MNQGKRGKIQKTMNYSYSVIMRRRRKRKEKASEKRVLKGMRSEVNEDNEQYWRD